MWRHCMEIRGEIEIQYGNQVFKLRGIADRIERADRWQLRHTGLQDRQNSGP